MSRVRDGQFPRTLQEAFGPYARWDEEVGESFVERHSVLLVWTIAILALVFIGWWVSR